MGFCRSEGEGGQVEYWVHARFLPAYSLHTQLPLIRLMLWLVMGGIFFTWLSHLADPLNVQRDWFEICIWKEFLWDINPNRVPLWIRGWAGKSLGCLLRDKKVHRNETSYSPLRFASWCATTYRSDLFILSGGAEGGGAAGQKGRSSIVGEERGSLLVEKWVDSVNMFVDRADCTQAGCALIWSRPAGIHLLPGILAAGEGRGANELPYQVHKWSRSWEGGGESKCWLLIRRGRADTGGIGTGQCRGQHWFAVHASSLLLINIYGQAVNQAGQTFLIIGIVILHFATGSVGRPKWNPLLKRGGWVWCWGAAKLCQRLNN